MSGTANTAQEVTAYANGGNGISAVGTGHKILKSTAGDIDRGNGLTGIAVDGSGALAQDNRAQSNRDAGFDIKGGTVAAPNRLRGDESNTGSAGSTKENAGPEYRLLGVIYNAGGGNKADNITVPKTTAPVKCPLFPATNATKTFASTFICE